MRGDSRNKFMANNDVSVRFNKVSFEYGQDKPILDEVSFSLRRGSKMTLMGQNGEQDGGMVFETLLFFCFFATR